MTRLGSLAGQGSAHTERSRPTLPSPAHPNPTRGVRTLVDGPGMRASTQSFGTERRIEVNRSVMGCSPISRYTRLPECEEDHQSAAADSVLVASESDCVVDRQAGGETSNARMRTASHGVTLPFVVLADWQRRILYGRHLEFTDSVGPDARCLASGTRPDELYRNHTAGPRSEVRKMIRGRWAFYAR